VTDKNVIKAIFLDADGVLWDDIGPGGILSGKKNAIQNLKLLSSIQKNECIKIVVSNQTFAARRKMNYIRFRFLVNTHLKSLVKLKLIDDFAVCYHHPNAKNFFLRRKCECRKPSPGLINLMLNKYNIIPQKCFLIGDRITDIQSGAAAGLKHLFLIVNSNMLEININSSSQHLQSVFIPLKNLKEFSLAWETINEN
jgi:D-glycero-D-manno-heptose 1,7-bisphosphate phosphatase